MFPKVKTLLHFSMDLDNVPLLILKCPIYISIKLI